MSVRVNVCTTTVSSRRAYIIDDDVAIGLWDCVLVTASAARMLNGSMLSCVATL